MSKNLNLIAALDIGSSKIAAMLAHGSKDNLNILGYAVRGSSGFNRGVFTDIKQMEQCVLSTIEALEVQTKERISEVMVTISDSVTHIKYTNSDINLSGKIITEQILNKIVLSIIENHIDPEYKVIHHFITAYHIDQMMNIENPIGMVANQIKIDMAIIYAPANFINNLENCLSNCQIEIKEIVSSTYANALGAITDIENQNGVTVIDFGHSSTSLCFVIKNKIMYLINIMIGSSHINSDISYILSVNLAAAERIKTLHGSATPSILDSHEIIKLEKEDMRINRGMVTEIIIARLDEILELLKEKINADKMQNILNHKIILTGGGSNMIGISEFVSNYFKTNVRLALSEGQYDDKFAAQYATLFGLIYYGLHTKIMPKKNILKDIFDKVKYSLNNRKNILFKNNRK